MHNARPRLATFVAVAVAHAALFIWLAKVRPTSAPTAEPETRILLFMLPSSEIARPSPPRSAARQAVTRQARPPDAQSNPGATPTEHAQSSAPVMIDWAQEAQRAASRQIDADEAAARRAAAFSTHNKTPDSLAPPAPAQPQFGWSHANTHRIESLPGGGFILNLSDRCAIVFAVMLIPVCKVGTTEPRGDLLQHMDDPPQLGSPLTDKP
jgi:cytoskeletal protein RodZ